MCLPALPTSWTTYRQWNWWGGARTERRSPVSCTSRSPRAGTCWPCEGGGPLIGHPSSGNASLMLPSALWHRISTCSDMNTVMFRIKPIGTVCLMFVWNFLGKACWGFENLIMVLLPMCIICTGNFIHLAENNAGTMYYYKCLPLYHSMILWRFIHNYNTHTCYYYGLQRRVSLCSHWGIILWIMYYFQSILLSFIVTWYYFCFYSVQMM